MSIVPPVPALPRVEMEEAFNRPSSAMSPDCEEIAIAPPSPESEE